MMVTSNKVLIVIDMQNDFITGTLANKTAAKKVKPICDYITEFKGDIILTRDTHGADYLASQEGKFLPVEHCIAGTAGQCIHDDILRALRGKKNHQVIDKPHFGALKWGNLIPGGLIKEIEICGTVTEICVVSNALILKAMFPEAKITIIKDLCAGLTPEGHEAAIKTMEACQCVIDITKYSDLDQ